MKTSMGFELGSLEQKLSLVKGARDKSETFHF